MDALFFLNAPLYALTADLFAPYAGVVQGITNFFFALTGAISPILTGWIVQVTGNFHAAFFLILSLSFISSLAVIFFQNPDRDKTC